MEVKITKNGRLMINGKFAKAEWTSLLDPKIRQALNRNHPVIK